MTGFTRIQGERFFRLTAMEPLDNNFNSNTTWKCQCACGNTWNVKAGHLKSGNTKSCGCLKREKSTANGHANKTHGLTKTVEYKTWSAMKRRCYNPETESYSDYGARGITVCERWKNSFENFLADMGKRPSNEHSIERINVDGHYEPGNCKWGTIDEQNNNKRTSVHFVMDGEKLSLTQIARKYDIPIATLVSRIYRDKLPIEEAVLKIANRRLVTFKGETKTVGEFARQYGINYGTLRDRLLAGIPFEKAVIVETKRLVYRGVETSIRKLAKEFEMSATGLASRLRRGLPLEQALSEKKWVKK